MPKCWGREKKPKVAKLLIPSQRLDLESMRCQADMLPISWLVSQGVFTVSGSRASRVVVCSS